MQAKSLEVLEYEKILEKLSAMARSGLVKKQILDLRPSTDMDYLEDELEKTGAMAKVIARNGNIDIFGLYDFTEIVGYIKRNGILDPVDEVIYIDRAVLEALHFHHVKSAHSGRCRVSAVSRVWYKHLCALHVSATSVVGAYDHQSCEFSVCACERIERELAHTGQ